MLTQEELKRQLEYNPDSGVFTWKEKFSKFGRNDIVGRVAGWRSKEGYIIICIGNVDYKAHRLAWLYVHGYFPYEDTDHINMVRDDNRLVNLRPATRTENQFNKPKQRNNTSGFRGVYWHKGCNKWESYIIANRVRRYLGGFHNKDDAIAAYQAAAKEVHGEFYRSEV